MATAPLPFQRDENVAAAEWKSRVDLAPFYRLAALNGFDA
jgi:hypothetical protein